MKLIEEGQTIHVSVHQSLPQGIKELSVHVERVYVSSGSFSKVAALSEIDRVKFFEKYFPFNPGKEIEVNDPLDIGLVTADQLIELLEDFTMRLKGLNRD